MSLLRAGTLSDWSLYSQCLAQSLAQGQRPLDGWTTERMLQNPGQFPRRSFVPTVLKPYWVRVLDSLGLSTVKNPSHSAGRPLKFLLNGFKNVPQIHLLSTYLLPTSYKTLVSLSWATTEASQTGCLLLPPHPHLSSMQQSEWSLKDTNRLDRLKMGTKFFASTPHQELQSIFPPFASGLDQWLVLSNRMQQKWLIELPGLGLD